MSQKKKVKEDLPVNYVKVTSQKNIQKKDKIN